MWYLIIIVILLSVSGILHVSLGAYADCGLCTNYGIACISETDFHVCVDRGNSGMKVDKSVRYSCAEGAICTDLREVCVPRNSSISNAVPLCTDLCNVCGYAKSFACTSRTTFALCEGYQITSIVGTCPGSLICDIDGPEICIEKCRQHNITCDLEFPTSTLKPTPLPVLTPAPTSTLKRTQTQTPTPTQTPTSVRQTPREVCAARKILGRFPYDNDNLCTKYVYCRFHGSVLVAVSNTCSIGTYFNQQTQLCETIKPSWCI